MQSLHINGTLYVEGDVTWDAPNGLPLNIYAKNVVACAVGKTPVTIQPGDACMKGDLVLGGSAYADEHIGTPKACVP